MSIMPRSNFPPEPLKEPTREEVTLYASWVGPVKRVLSIIETTLKNGCRLYGPLFEGGIHVVDKATVYEQMPYGPLVADVMIDLEIMDRQECRRCQAEGTDAMGRPCPACGGGGSMVSLKAGHEMENAVQRLKDEIGRLLDAVPNNSRKKLIRSLSQWKEIERAIGNVDEFGGVELSAGCRYVTGDRGISLTASAPDPSSNIIYGPQGIISSPIPDQETDSASE